MRRLLVKITRKRAVNELKKLTVVPRCWTVPRTGESFAYLLDLTEDSKAWTRDDGRQMSMAAVIKSEVSLSLHTWLLWRLKHVSLQDQDTWGDGTSGSDSNAVQVLAFGKDPIPCRYAKHVCQGVYHCVHVDPSILQDLERYEPSEKDQQWIYQQEHQLDIAQRDDPTVRAAM